MAAAEHGLSHREGGTGGLQIPGRVEIHSVCSEQGEGCCVPPRSALALQFTIWAFIYRNSCIAHRRPAFSPSWQPFEREKLAVRFLLWLLQYSAVGNTEVSKSGLRRSWGVCLMRRIKIWGENETLPLQKLRATAIKAEFAK